QVAEDHGTAVGMAPSPSVFLAAVAQRTRRLRFGTMVFALPLHHPLRLIEEICMLDHLSGGRLDIGFGRGSSPIELAYYGEDPAAAPEGYAGSLELVLQGLTHEALHFHGKRVSFAALPGPALPSPRGPGTARPPTNPPPADLVRGACARQRRARGPQGTPYGQPRSAGGHARLQRALSHDMAAPAWRCRAAQAGARPL